VFWHIGPIGRWNPTHWISIVVEQFVALEQFSASNIRDMLEAEPEVLLSIHDAGTFERMFIRGMLFYSSRGTNWRILDSPPHHKSMHPAYELASLEHLWRFCSTAALDDIVLYLHTKSNDEWRHILQHFVLTKADDAVCNLRNGWDMVGPLFQNVGMPIYHGNFWWATCKHIRNLPMPRLIQESGTVGNGKWKGSGWRDGSGRFAAETWLMRTSEMKSQKDVYVKSCFGVPWSSKEKTPSECSVFAWNLRCDVT
jgi:hypothetical protein